MNVIFENDQWRVLFFHGTEQLRVYGVASTVGSVDYACRRVAKLANEGDADAIWTIMMCEEDPNLLEALAYIS